MARKWDEINKTTAMKKIKKRQNNIIENYSSRWHIVASQSVCRQIHVGKTKQ